MTNEEIFIRFLKEHRKYSSFKRNIGNYRRTVRIENIIMGSFNWGDTEEGGNYWHRIYEKWDKLCKHFDLKGEIDLNKI